MKILLISECFGPENVVGAIRVTKLAKYLTAANHEVSVVTTSDIKKVDPLLVNDIKTLKEVVRVSNTKLFKMFYNFVYRIHEPARQTIEQKSRDNSLIEKSQQEAKRENLIIEIIKAIREYIMRVWKEIDFTYNASRVIDRQLDCSSYDVMISSFKPLSSHLIALRIHRRFKTPWVADFRDPIDTKERKLIKLFYKRKEKSIIKHADCIVTVSDGFGRMICADSKRYSAITNGYDKDDLAHIPTSSHLNHSLLNITYVGSLYDTRQDMSAFFSILKELIDEQKIDAGRIAINYIGVKGYKLKAQADKYRLAEIVRDMGFVDRLTSLQIQNESDVMLLASWNNSNYKGVIPAKLFEYMLLKKPIVACIVGNEPKSEVRTIIEKCNIGTVMEQCTEPNESRVVKASILTMYEEFFRNGFIRLQGNINELNKYDYNSLINRWQAIIKCASELENND